MTERLELELVAKDDMSPALKSAKEHTKELREQTELLGEVVGGKLAKGITEGNFKLLAMVGAIEAVKMGFEALKEAGELVVEGLESLYETFAQLEDVNQVFDVRYGEEGNAVLQEMVKSAEDVGEETGRAYQLAKKLAGAYDNPEAAKSLLKTVEDIRHTFGETTVSGQKSIDAAAQYFNLLSIKTSAGEKDLKRFNTEFGRGADLEKALAAVQGKSLETVRGELKKNLVPINDYIFAIQRLAGTDAAGKVHGPGELAAELSKTNLVDQVNRVKDVWEEFKITIAKGLFTPEVVDNIKKFADSLKEFLEMPETKAFIHDLATGIGDLAKRLTTFDFKALKFELLGLLEDFKAVFDNPLVKAAVVGLVIVVGVLVAAVAVLGIALALVGVVVYGIWEAFVFLGKGLFIVNQWLGDLATKAVEWGEKIVKGLADGIMNAVHHVIDAAKHVATTVTNFFAEHFKIHSPSLVMEEMGVNVSQGLAVGIDKGKPNVKDSYEGVLPTPQVNNTNNTSTKTGDVMVNMTFELKMPEAGASGHLSTEGLEEVAHMFRRQADEALVLALSRSQLQGGV